MLKNSKSDHSELHAISVKEGVRSAIERGKELAEKDAALAKWKWMDFYCLDSKTGDNRRAAFQVHDFVNLFNVEEFVVVEQRGEFLNATIEILYRSSITEDEIENKWYEYITDWREKH